MIVIEDMINELEFLNEEVDNDALRVTIDFLRYMRRNIAGRGTLTGFLSDDKYREMKL
tara:strand:+ start:801 stop:974 length:174 start_codon:yes stop_codon:yes gene_type:complete